MLCIRARTRMSWISTTRRMPFSWCGGVRWPGTKTCEASRLTLSTRRPSAGRGTSGSERTMGPGAGVLVAVVVVVMVIVVAVLQRWC